MHGELSGAAADLLTWLGLCQSSLIRQCLWQKPYHCCASWRDLLPVIPRVPGGPYEQLEHMDGLHPFPD